MKIFSLMSLIFLSTLHQYIGKDQQTAITIQGKVISLEESFPLKDVTVNVKGTNRSAVTGANGKFSLSILPEDKILVIQLASYQTAEVAIHDKPDYEIVLQHSGSDASVINKVFQTTNIFNQSAIVHCR
jgi:hypothetical protein